MARRLPAPSRVRAGDAWAPGSTLQPLRATELRGGGGALPSRACQPVREPGRRVGASTLAQQAPGTKAWQRSTSSSAAEAALLFWGQCLGIWAGEGWVPQAEALLQAQGGPAPASTPRASSSPAAAVLEVPVCQALALRLCEPGEQVTCEELVRGGVLVHTGPCTWLARREVRGVGGWGGIVWGVLGGGTGGDMEQGEPRALTAGD